MSQRVLITAGVSGISREIARAFAESGASAFVCGIDADGLARLEQEVPGVRTTTCDMGSRADIERMMRDGLAALGGPDVLVNDACVAGPTAPVEGYDPGAWDTVVAVNLTGTFDVTRLAIPHLRRSAAGVIINMSSVAGQLGYANRSAYSATKWAVVGFTKTLAIELGPAGIRANAILVDPRDIAALAVFLASDGAKSISGQVLPVDNDMQQAS
ncbi:MAG: SDR family oxidoreductase [Gemmatimonadaceae bacterium]